MTQLKAGDLVSVSLERDGLVLCEVFELESCLYLRPYGVRFGNNWRYPVGSVVVCRHLGNTQYLAISQICEVWNAYIDELATKEPGFAKLKVTPKQQETLVLAGQYLELDV